MKTRFAKWAVPVVLIVAFISWRSPSRDDATVAGHERQTDPQEDQATVAATPVARPDPPEHYDAGVMEMPSPDPDATPVVAARDPAVERVLLEAKYGDAPDQLGLIEPAYGYDGLVYPPQGFAPLADGRMIVLDTAKTRLVWFGADGRMERALPLPEDFRLPADVVVTQDGTIVVVDHEGVQTSGTVMLDSAGNVKARLPQLSALMTDVYAVGNDIFMSSGVLKSIKAGDTSGSASDETPGLFNQDGTIPGRVAPDGRTVINASIVRGDRTQLLVSSVRGERPDHVFSRVYAMGAELRGIPDVQVDGHGLIYVITRHARREALLCLRGEDGEPVGHVLLPRQQADGELFSPFVVLESGGLVMQQLRKGGVTYWFIDCR